MKLILTKTFLKEQGITIEKDPTRACGYKIMHYARKMNTHVKDFDWKELKPSIARRYHKISKNTTQYYVVSWSNYANSKERTSFCFPLSRLVYLWYSDLEELPAKLDVDHIDNNSLNNDFSNLQLLTRAENLAKRFIKGANQYKYLIK